MHNFKPGDLAVILRGGNPANAGKCVELVRLIADGDFYEDPTGKLAGRIFNNAGVSVWLVVGDVSDQLTGGKSYSGFTQKAEENLMPLRGDFKPEEDDLAEYADVSFYDLRTGRQRLVGGRA